MPYCFEYKLLFVHIPKNAGRSIEEAIFQSPTAPHSGRRSFVNRVFHGLSKMTAPRLPSKTLIGSLDQVLAAQHLTYVEMEMLGLLPCAPDSVDSVFAVCRNPFDRVVSSINHFWPGDQKLPTRPAEFEHALLAWLHRDVKDHNQRAHRRTQVDFILDKRGQRVADRILRFEHLVEDFSEFMREYGQPQVQLPWNGNSGRTGSYRDYFTDAARRAVETEFGEDLETFKYEF